jgi:hypothetical protein
MAILYGAKLASLLLLLLLLLFLLFPFTDLDMSLSPDAERESSLANLKDACWSSTLLVGFPGFDDFVRTLLPALLFCRCFDFLLESEEPRTSSPFPRFADLPLVRVSLPL